MIYDAGWGVAVMVRGCCHGDFCCKDVVRKYHMIDRFGNLKIHFTVDRFGI